MPDLSALSLLIVGFLFGVRHALDADHVVAISTITTEQRSLRRSCIIGFCWGLGHTAVLLAAAVAVMGFRLSISEEWAQIFEAGVGVMLIALGLSAGWALWSERVHVHVHVHGDGPGHLHVHSHRDGPEHTHLHRYRTEYKSLAVGMVHGLAGSAAVLLLLLPAVSSVTAGVIYILAFGAGSIAGMMAIGAAISMPFTAGAGGLVRTHRMIRALAGLASIALGSGILYEFILKAGLPSGQ